MKETAQKKPTTAPINDKIRAPRVQLILATGENRGIVSRDEMLRAATEAGLDAVIIADEGAEGVPVVKIMDFGKAAYAKKKKLTEAKKKQKVIQVKEIKLRPKIAENDYQTKLNQGIEFLKDGKRLKITLEFKGREQASMENRGKELFEKINKTLEAQNLLDDVAQEHDSAMGKNWSRVYYLKKLK